MDAFFMWVSENPEVASGIVGGVAAVLAGTVPNRYLSYIKIAKQIWEKMKKNRENLNNKEK